MTLLPSIETHAAYKGKGKMVGDNCSDIHNFV